MSEYNPPARKEYILKQKEEHGRHLFGVLPAQYPREILWAMNALPVEMWDPPVALAEANAHLQPYICSIVKLGLELVLQGKCDMLDGFVFPHTCNSIQNMASVVHDYIGLSKPCYFFYHPKAPYRPSSREYYRAHLKDFAARLSHQLGELDLSTLKEAVKKGQELSALVQSLYEARADGELKAANATFYRVLRQGEFLHPDDYIPLLHAFSKDPDGPSLEGPKILLSGVLPNPPALLDLLDERGVLVAGDDFLACSRRWLVPPSQEEDPFDALTESYFAMPPCTTKGSAVADHIDFLSEQAERSGASGVLFLMVKFCEPELFDLPQVVEGLKAKGLATLTVECEVNQGFGGQMTTRVEAFLESIS